MGLFDALTTAVGGLQAQSFALQNISGNIANSQTTGFKETDTSFDALVASAAEGEQTSGSVIAGSVATNTVQGSIQSATVSTNMAINGDGYFVVGQPTSFSDNQPVFSGINDYTRRGDFQENSGRLSGQRRRLLPDGHSGERHDRQSARQRPLGPPIQQQLRAGPADHANSVPSQSREQPHDRRQQQHRAGLQPAQSNRIYGQSAGGSAGGGEHHRHRGDLAAGREGGGNRERHRLRAALNTPLASLGFTAGPPATTRHGERRNQHDHLHIHGRRQGLGSRTPPSTRSGAPRT